MIYSQDEFVSLMTCSGWALVGADSELNNQTLAADSTSHGNLYDAQVPFSIHINVPLVYELIEPRNTRKLLSFRIKTFLGNIQDRRGQGISKYHLFYFLSQQKNIKLGKQ